MNTAIIPGRRPRRNPKEDGYPLVYRNERGTWYYCSTAQRYFHESQIARPIQSTRHGVIIWCPLCDVMMRTKNDPAYDPASPQPHSYLTEDE